jgi:hypothetical protein
MLIENLSLNGGLTLSGAVNPPVVTSGLILEFRPNSYPGSGNIWYNTVNSYSYIQGTVAGNPAFNSNTGFTFAEIPLPNYQGIDVGNWPAINFGTSSYTIEIWFKIPNNPGSSPPLINKNQYDGTSENVKTPYQVYVGGPDSVNFVVWGNTIGGVNGITLPNTVQNNTWYQTVGVWNYGTNVLQAYLNGFANGFPGDLSIMYGQDPRNSWPVRIGYAKTGFAVPDNINQFVGSIGIVRIYGKALSGFEIQQNFSADRGIFGI